MTYGLMKTPEPEPPAARVLADEGEEQHDQQTPDDVFEQEGLGLIAKPAAPVLHAEVIGEGEVVFVEVER